MEGARPGDQLARNDRAYLEVALHRLAAHGHIAARGEREITIRIDEHGKVRWFEARRIRVAAGELEHDDDGANTT